MKQTQMEWDQFHGSQYEAEIHAQAITGNGYIKPELSLYECREILRALSVCQWDDEYSQIPETRTAHEKIRHAMVEHLKG